MLRKIWRNPQAVIGLGLIVLICAVAILAPLLAPHAPDEVNPLMKYQAPSADYPLGTDQLGRCELSRLLYGARASLGRDYIVAARVSGCGMWQLIVHHLIPNILPQFLVYFSTGVASAILTVSSFSFLGLGLPSGTAEWGAMLEEAQVALYSHPELLIYPGICIFIAAAGFNLFGEALRDILQPQEDVL